jgi:hypothetical protein
MHDRLARPQRLVAEGTPPPSGRGKGGEMKVFLS